MAWVAVLTAVVLLGSTAVTREGTSATSPPDPSVGDTWSFLAPWVARSIINVYALGSARAPNTAATGDPTVAAPRVGAVAGRLRRLGCAWQSWKHEVECTGEQHKPAAASAQTGGTSASWAHAGATKTKAKGKSHHVSKPACNWDTTHNRCRPSATEVGGESKAGVPWRVFSLAPTLYKLVA